MPRAFITGITGQDGGYLAERLEAESWEVHGLVHGGDRNVESMRRRTPSAVLHEGDLGDPAGLIALLEELRPAEIYNLGGISSVAASWQDPVMTARVTGLGPAAILHGAARLHDAGHPVRVLQASSAEIFGSARRSPQDESTPLRPQNPYGAAKAYAHQLCAVYRARGVFAAACVLYNHESPRRPETFVTRKITRAAARIAQGRQQTVSLGNLDARRVWGWAPDYVDAMIRTIRHGSAEEFVVATGEAHSVRELAEAAFLRAGVPDWPSRISVDAGLGRPTDAAEQVGNPAKARAVLGWSPTVRFPEMVARMVEADLAAEAQS
ncbi:MAG: GDP-mannose 4,6-dehydratase [bacterium]